MDRAPTPTGPDLHGETHRGRVRTQNQDHFLVCVLGAGIRVVATSLPTIPDTWTRASAESADPDEVIVAAVADGVGGGPGGEEAARGALMLLPGAVERALESVSDDRGIGADLRAAVLAVHAHLNEMSDRDPAISGMATTLTAWVGVGPRAWVLQVGDSRCYRLRAGELQCLTVDQTMAQDLVNRGLVPSPRQAPAGWDNILTSALGGSGADPVIQVTDRRPEDVVLVCSDGVMKHISDEGLRDMMAGDDSSESMARRIVQDSVADGGIDNITAVLVREPTEE